MNSNDLSDEHIVRKVQRGKTDSFRVIVDRYRDRIFSIGMRFFYNGDDAEDFTQEVFLKVFDKIGSYREIAPFRFWLVKLAYNHAINLKKSLAGERENISLENPDILYCGKSPDEIHAGNEVKEILLHEIEKLPERYRVCLDLYFFFGLKYIEINEITGYPVNTIKSDVLRAKNILRDRLRGTAAEEFYEMQ